MSKIKEIVKKLIPKRLKAKIIDNTKKKHESKYRETNASYGSEHADKTFYLIRRPSGAGLFSDFHYNLSHIIYADSRGWLPVIDMENYPNYYKEKELIKGLSNAWEYYWEQPCGYNLNDIKNAKNVVISNGQPRFEAYDFTLNSIAKNDTQVILKNNDYINKYIRLKKDVAEKIEQLYNNLFKGQKVLGVSWRGTDYQALKPKGHQIQPQLEQTMDKIEEVQKLWSFDKIFFMSEETKAIKRMKKFAGGGGLNLITIEKASIDDYDGKTCTPDWHHDRPNNKYLSGLEYLLEVYLMSKCDCIVAGNVNGSVAAIEINGCKYKERFVFDLGVFE